VIDTVMNSTFRDCPTTIQMLRTRDTRIHCVQQTFRRNCRRATAYLMINYSKFHSFVSIQLSDFCIRTVRARAVNGTNTIAHVEFIAVRTVGSMGEARFLTRGAAENDRVSGGRLFPPRAACLAAMDDRRSSPLCWPAEERRTRPRLTPTPSPPACRLVGRSRRVRAMIR